jgi:hypothetical protein
LPLPPASWLQIPSAHVEAVLDSDDGDADVQWAANSGRDVDGKGNTADSSSEDVDGDDGRQEDGGGVVSQHNAAGSNGDDRDEVGEEAGLPSRIPSKDWAELFPELQLQIENAIMELGGEVGVFALIMSVGTPPTVTTNPASANTCDVGTVLRGCFQRCVLPAKVSLQTCTSISTWTARQVAPKLNWSCPSDAVWINPGANGTLACHNSDQARCLRCA